MADPWFDEMRMKALFKEAVLEAFQERRDLFYDIVAEVGEDVALGNAIAEGAGTESVSREGVMRALKG